MSLIVQVEQGKLRGKEKKSVLTGIKYYSFQGIPYAEKPQRFQTPEPKQKWKEEIYDATKERDICIQIDPKFKTVGSENCLYLNVNTPQIPSTIKVPKPVMVYIHGGGFTTGSGSEKTCSPDFLIGHDVIVVTLNYRLHVLGFLNLGIPECPGNAGLKDQSLALRWVKKNISNFGGDPENITIFGESAGGASTHHQTISPMSKGLFKKAITQSGSVLSYWAMVHNPYEIGFEFGKKLGFKGEDKQALLDFLKLQDAGDLVYGALELQKDLRKQYPFRCTDIAFAPSVEAIKDGAFLTDLPKNILKTADPLPIITGADSKDGMLIFFLAPTESFKLLEEDFSLVLRNNFNIDPETDVLQLANKVKKHYFGNKKADLDAADEISSLFTDLFYYNLYEAIENVVESSCPAYVYEFNYDGNLNLLKKTAEEIIHRTLEGACHADEKGYLFYRMEGGEIPSFKEDDLKVINEITTLWTNFAKYSDPSTTMEWKPTTKKDQSYLRIDAESKVIQGPIYGERLQTLKKLLDDHAKPSNKI